MWKCGVSLGESRKKAIGVDVDRARVADSIDSSVIAILSTIQLVSIMMEGYFSSFMKSGSKHLDCPIDSCIAPDTYQVSTPTVGQKCTSTFLDTHRATGNKWHPIDFTVLLL
jgi:hypothetical protein